MANANTAEKIVAMLACLALTGCTGKVELSQADQQAIARCSQAGMKPVILVYADGNNAQINEIRCIP